MADTKTFSSVGVDAAAADLGAIVLVILAEAERQGVELPEGFAVRVATSVSKRYGRVLLALAWSYYQAGIDRSVTDAAHERPTPVAPEPKT